MRDGGTVVGLAFQNLPAAENIGFIIPPPIIHRFLSDVVATGSHGGFCTLGVRCQPIENAALRSYLRLPPGVSGVLVNAVTPLTAAAGAGGLRKDDVLTAFDGVPIGADGTVALRGRERVSFDHLVSLKRPGELARLSLVRDGAPAVVELRLAPAPTLVPVQLYDRLPSYFVYAGLVFAPLSQPHLHESGEDWFNTAPRKLTDLALHGKLRARGDQVVLLSQVLVDDVNAGYQPFADLQVLACGGVRVRNLRHLRALLLAEAGAFIRLDLDDDRVLVLDRAAAEAAHDRILMRHRVPAPVSADLLREDAENDAQDATAAAETPARL